MNTIIISPVFLVLTGIIIFLIAQFLKSSYKIIFSLAGLTLIALFFYKLLSIRGGSDSLAYDLNNLDFKLSFSNIYYLVLAINITGFVLWVAVIFRIAFNDKVAKNLQQSILIAAGFVMIINLLVFYVLGSVIGLVCLPVLTISFYIAYKNYINKLPKSNP